PLPVLRLVLPAGERPGTIKCLIDGTLEVIDAGDLLLGRDQGVAESDVGMRFRSAATVVEFKLYDFAAGLDARDLRACVVGAEHHRVVPFGGTDRSVRTRHSEREKNDDAKFSKHR